MSGESGGRGLPDQTSAVAIVTTFHPEPGLIDRLTSIIGQVGRVLIVDNGSEVSEQAEVRTLVARGEVDALWNGANLGLAIALDQGLRWAADRGADWALLLDQDSQPEPGIVAEAARVIGAAGGARWRRSGPGWSGPVAEFSRTDRPARASKAVTACPEHAGHGHDRRRQRCRMGAGR